MADIFIALQAETFCDALERKLRKEHCVTVCYDGETALTQLLEKRPDVLILDLSLTMIDGLQIIRKLGDHRPDIVIALTTFPGYRVMQMIRDLHIDIAISKPCRPEAVLDHLTHIFSLRQQSCAAMDPQRRCAEHLRTLSFPEHRKGFYQLQVGMPLYAADPRQSLTKELYPNIATLCGNDNGKQVERSIRDLIEASWRQRNEPVWKRYFPNYSCCPTNKQFFSNLARVLEEEDWENLY